MEKTTLSEFIKENERMIFVLGIFLALLPLSFDTIKDLNPKYAGWTAIATLLAVSLILKHFFLDQEKELSADAFLFVGCLATIFVTTALLTYEIFTETTLSFVDVALSTLYLITGLFFSSKIFRKIDEIIEKKEEMRFFANLFFLLLSIVLFVSNIDQTINELLLKINITINPILTVEHEMLFLGGIYFMILIYGALISGVGYFGRELFYEQFLLKILDKIKNILNKYKDKKDQQ